MRICRKCGEEFKIWAKIDGKKRNFAGRKFCLKCSPLGSRNTKPDDPARPSKFGQKDYKKNPYGTWSKETKEKYVKNCYLRGLNRKKDLVELKGGKCKSCGYNKCLRCLTFHHRDASTKQFSLTMREIAGMSWESVLEEAEKCDLLCLNCHMELEDEIGRSKYVK